MNRTRILVAVTAIAIATTSSIATDCFSQEKESEAVVRITDSKLHTINYGIDSLKHWVDKLGANDTQKAKRLLNDYRRLSNRFSRIPESESQQYQYVLERLNSIKSQLESVTSGKEESSNTAETSQPTKLEKRPKGLDSIAARLKNLEQDIPGYKDGNQRFRSRVRNDLKTLQASFGRIEVSAHEDYLAIQKRLENAEVAITPADGQLAMSDSQIQSFLKEMDEKYGQLITLPEARDMMKTRELTPEDVDQFISRMKAFKDHSSRDLPRIKHIVDATGQGQRWFKWLSGDGNRQLEKEISIARKRMNQLVEYGMRDIRHRSELNTEENRYAFNNESIRENVEATFARTMGTIQQSVRFRQLLGEKVTESKAESELQKYMATYREKVALSAKVRELPQEVGTPELHKLASETLENEKYGVGKVVLQIVNSEPMPRERIEHKPFNRKIETIIREWKEYQVTTVEEEGGKLFVYTNNLVKFSRAPQPTPIGKWILNHRYKNGELTKEKLEAAKEK